MPPVSVVVSVLVSVALELESVELESVELESVSPISSVSKSEPSGPP